MTDLAYLSATEALTLFKGRQLSPVELMRAVIARAEEVEPTVNALCHTFYEAALDQAGEAEARYGRRGMAPRPLEGIPLAVKEEEPVAGQPWTQGSLIGADEVAEHSSVLAQRMLEAGAIVHARTTIPEFGTAPFTQSKLWGITRNPWNPRFGAGGSSGGSGAALAAGTTILATGSDIAGSIRIPASFNGVVGFKPPFGRVPGDPPFNADRYLAYGPMARTVRDTALLQDVIAGPDLSDHNSVAPKHELPHELGAIEGLRVAVSVDFGGWAVDPEVRRNTLDSANALAASGAVVEQVALDLPREKVQRAAGIHFCQTIGYLEDLIAGHPGVTCDYLTASLAHLRRLGEGGSVMEGQLIEAELWRSVADVLRHFDVLLCPTVATRGLIADSDYVDGPPIEVDGQRFEDVLDVVMTLPFNVLGTCPVLAVPSGFADNGLPTGVQLVGHPFQDDTVFLAGAALERERPWLDCPERRPGAIAARA